MTPKAQLVLALVLLLVVFPGLVWAMLADIRSGETTFTRRWTPPMRVFRRDEDPGRFWQQIIMCAFADLIPLGLGIWFLYDAVRTF